MRKQSSVVSGLRRRSALRTLGLGAGAALVGPGVLGLVAGCGNDDETTSGGLQPVKFGWWGATCEAPLYAAHHRGFFEREGLEVELVNLGQSSAKDALASGKVDAVPGITFEWLKPIEQGQDIVVTGGIHGGCLRLVVGAKTGITTLEGLRGTTIATDQIGGSAHSFFSVVLAAAGIDPQNDVTFVAYPGAQLQTAIQRGEVAGAAASDPFPFVIVSDGDGIELVSNLTGAYQDHFCCALGINGAFVDETPVTAAALTRALLSAAQWVGSNIDAIAQIEADQEYVPIEAAVTAKLLSTYTWNPSVTRLKDNLDQYAKEFKTTGILDQGTDPAELASRAFRDVTGGDVGIDGTDPTHSASALSASGTPVSANASGVGYALTSAQREQLLAHACHLTGGQVS